MENNSNQIPNTCMDIESMRRFSKITHKLKLSESATTRSPFIVRLKNLTNKKLFKVDVLNWGHKSQTDIEYGAVCGIGYTEMLNQFSSESYKFVSIRYNVKHKNPKYRSKQYGNNLRLYYEESDGVMPTIQIPFNYTDNLQTDNDCITVHFVFSFDYLDKIQLDFLMPKAEVNFYFFPEIQISKEQITIPKKKMTLGEYIGIQQDKYDRYVLGKYIIWCGEDKELEASNDLEHAEKRAFELSKEYPVVDVCQTIFDYDEYEGCYMTHIILASYIGGFKYEISSPVTLEITTIKDINVFGFNIPKGRIVRFFGTFRLIIYNDIDATKTSLGNNDKVLLRGNEDAVLLETNKYDGKTPSEFMREIERQNKELITL
jgi:hypothetical protein